MRSLPSLFSVPNSFHAATFVTGVPSGYLASEKEANLYGMSTPSAVFALRRNSSNFLPPFVRDF